VLNLLITNTLLTLQVASTRMNAQSSRSHSVFTLISEQQKTEEIGDVQRQTSLSSKVNLVDLAGSERAGKTGATGSTLKQGTTSLHSCQILSYSHSWKSSREAVRETAYSILINLFRRCLYQSGSYELGKRD